MAVPSLPPLNLSAFNSGPAVSGASPTVNANWQPEAWDPFGNGSASIGGVPLALVALAGLAGLYFWKR